MILGTANFMNEYRGVKIDKKTCLNILKEFEALGGKIVNTADDYGDSESLVIEYVNNSGLEILYKEHEHSMLTLKDLIGSSIYYPHQLSQYDEIIEIPNCSIWDDYLPIIHLHAKIFVRSNYTIDKKHHIKNLEYIDDYIVGVENIEQLRENMRIYR